MRQAIASPWGGAARRSTSLARNLDRDPGRPSKRGGRWNPDRFTGKTMERPAFTRLLRHVRAGEVRQIAVWRLDRLGRSAEVADRPVR